MKSNVTYIVIAARHNEWMISNVLDNSRHKVRMPSIVPAKSNVPYIVIEGRHYEWMISNVPDNSRITSIVPAMSLCLHCLIVYETTRDTSQIALDLLAKLHRVTARLQATRPVTLNLFQTSQC